MYRPSISLFEHGGYEEGRAHAPIVGLGLGMHLHLFDFYKIGIFIAAICTAISPRMVIISLSKKKPERPKAHSLGHRPKTVIDIEMFSLKG